MTHVERSKASDPLSREMKFAIEYVTGDSFVLLFARSKFSLSLFGHSSFSFPARVFHPHSLALVSRSVLSLSLSRSPSLSLHPRDTGYKGHKVDTEEAAEMNSCC